MNILRNLLVLGFSLFFVSNALGINTVYNGLPDTTITVEWDYYRSENGRGWRANEKLYPGYCFIFRESKHWQSLLPFVSMMPLVRLKISSRNRVLYQCEGEENCKKTAFQDKVVVQGADGQPLLVSIPEGGIDGDSIDCDALFGG